MKEKIEAIITEAIDRGLAFVEDDFAEMDNGESVYNPFVDKENATMWLKEKLLELAKS